MCHPNSLVDFGQIRLRQQGSSEALPPKEFSGGEVNGASIPDISLPFNALDQLSTELGYILGCHA
jgi:hypothetical protein